MLGVAINFSLVAAFTAAVMALAASPFVGLSAPWQRTFYSIGMAIATFAVSYALRGAIGA
ncbi:MAG: hypothetical protein ACTHJV_12325 [Rhizobiaceae bacterium]